MSTSEASIRRFVVKEFKRAGDSGSVDRNQCKIWVRKVFIRSDLTIRILKSRFVDYLGISKLGDDDEKRLRTVNEKSDSDLDPTPRKTISRKRKLEKVEKKTSRKESKPKVVPIGCEARRKKERKKKKLILQDEESGEIKRLKKMILACGMRKPYKRLFADCKSDKEKAKILKDILDEAGIEGRPTLEKCRELKRKREEKAELDALDVDNILKTPEGSRRTKRSSGAGFGSRAEENEESETRISRIMKRIASDTDSD